MKIGQTIPNKYAGSLAACTEISRRNNDMKAFKAMRNAAAKAK